MSKLGTAEIAAVYGGIDSGSQGAGRPVDAAYLRALAINAGRLAGKGHQAFRFVYSSDLASQVDYETGSLANSSIAAFVLPYWYPILHTQVPIFKMPGLSAYTVKITSQIDTADDVVWMQFCTSKRPFNPQGHPGDRYGNTITITGTGSPNVDTLTDLVASLDTRDWISIYIMGQVTTRDGDTATYGSPASGAFTGGFRNNGGYTEWGQWDSGSETWNWGPSNDTWASGGHVVEFLSSGTLVAGPFLITDVEKIDGLSLPGGMTTGQWVFRLTPQMSEAEQRAFGSFGSHDLTFRIREIPSMHIFDIVGQLQDRTR